LALIALLKAAALFLVAACIFYVKARMPKWHWLLPGTIIAFIVIDLALFANRFIVTENVERDMKQNEEFIALLASESDMYRVLPYYGDQSGRLGSLFAPSDNMFIQYGLFTFGGYEPYELLHYANVRQVLYRQLDKGDSSFLDLLNIKWIVTRDSLDHLQLPLIWHDAVKIYYNPHALPRIWMCYKLRFARNDAEALTLLENGEINIREEVILSQQLPGPLIDSDNAPSCRTIAASLLSPNIYRATVETSRPGVLVLNDAYFPGWKAYIDGEEAIVLRVNYLLKGVFVPEGVHEVALRYEPASFRIGAIISEVMVGVVLLGFIG